MIVKFSIKESIILKDFLKKEIPGRLIVAINKDGQYLVNNQKVKNYYMLNSGDELAIVLPKEKVSSRIKPFYRPLKIVYEDSYMLVIDKDNNIPVTPTKNHDEDALACYIYGYYLKQGIEAGIHLVSRLDLPTTGLIVVAKSAYIKYLLQKSGMTKHYLAMVEGHLESGYIESDIVEKPDAFLKRKIATGSSAKTRYELLKSIDGNSLIKAHLITGKTHQLRIHFAHLNHPIMGDSLYGKSNGDLKLHSSFLSFVHPITLETINLKSLPSWLTLDQ